MAHRHHWRVGADSLFAVVGEYIEVADQLGARRAAIRWFVAHGYDGFLPPAILALEIGLDAATFQGRFFEGEGLEGVERDLRAARKLASTDALVLTVRVGTVEQQVSLQQGIRMLSETRRPK